MEVTRSDGFPHDIKISSGGYDLHLLHLHDVFELRSNFPRLPQQFRVQKMPHRPLVSVTVIRVSKPK